MCHSRQLAYTAWVRGTAPSFLVCQYWKSKSSVFQLLYGFPQGSVLVLYLDVGVDPKKSTGVDLGTSSRIKSVSFGAVDPPSNVTLKSDFIPSRPIVYFLRTFLWFKWMDKIIHYLKIHNLLYNLHLQFSLSLTLDILEIRSLQLRLIERQSIAYWL